jgi:hypothetical protein
MRRSLVPPRLAVDFVAPPAPAGFGRVLLVLSVFALLIGGAHLGVSWRAYRQERAEFASVLQRGSPPVSEGSRRTAATAAGLQSAGTVARGLTAPWPELQRSIETIRNKDVALQIVEAVAARQSVRITADARNFEAMLDYLEQLRARTLTEVVLTSHQVQLQQPGTPIRFQVQARWGGGDAPLAAESPAATTQANNADPVRGAP